MLSIYCNYRNKDMDAVNICQICHIFFRTLRKVVLDINDRVSD